MPWNSGYKGGVQGKAPSGGGWNSKFTAPSPAAPATKAGSGGLLGTLERIPGAFGSNLYHAAVNMPAGVYAIGKAFGTDVAQSVKDLPVVIAHPDRPPPPLGKQTLGLLGAQAHAVKGQLQHPLREPGYTALDLLMVAEPVMRGTAQFNAARQVAASGGDTGAVMRALTTKPEIVPRTLTRGGLTVAPETSRSFLGSTVQKATDATLQARAAGKPGGVSDRLLARKVGKVVGQQARMQTQIAKGPGQAIIALGKKLSPGEQKALQVTAEQAPLADRITATTARIANAPDAAAAARHQAELDLLQQAAPHLTTGPEGLPTLVAPKLQKVYARMASVAKGRETLLQSLGMLSDEAIQSRTTKAARIAVGQPFEGQPLSLEALRAPGGIENAGTPALQSRLASLEADYQNLVESAMGAKPGDYRNVTALQNGRLRRGNYPTVTEQLRSHAENQIQQAMRANPDAPAVKAWTAKLAEADAITQELTRRADVKIGLEKPRVAAEPALLTPTPEAVRIPDVAMPAPRSLFRAPTVGGQGTIGRLRAPGSVTHEYTGALREQGLRRQDTTRLVGESSLEAAKYAGLKHVHDLVRQAASAVPTRADDIAVRLDQIKPGERLPLGVKRHLADPEEAFAKATPAEGAAMLDRVKSTLFFPGRGSKGAPWELSPTVNDAARAEFERLYAQGKIGWVPRSMLGDLAKPSAPLAAVAGRTPVRVIDAVNNAQRFAILYLKPAYAIPNILGNAALNILQQGFAAVPNLTRASLIDAKLGPEYAARIDAAMGEGVAQAISAHGEGRFAGVVDVAARGWSKVVDTPFRRSSFIYEARRAGYKTPTEIQRLLADPAEAETLNRVALSANREIIDYANLSPVEREIVRRVIFFYPWIKGSTVYAARFVREHPVKAGVVAQIGRTGQQQAQQQLGVPVPSYLEGAFPVGGGLVNPSSAALFQTPAQVGMALQGLATGNIPRVAEGAAFNTPALDLALAELYRRDPQSGFAYPGGTNALRVAQDQLLRSLPQTTLARNLKAATSGQGGSKLYPPTVRSSLLQFLVGGLAPRPYNKTELARLAAREKTQMRTGR